MVGDVSQRGTPDGVAKMNGTSASATRPPGRASPRAPVEARAQRVERQHRRRQEEARVPVGPDQRQRDQRPQQPRAAGLGARQRQQQRRRARGTSPGAAARRSAARRPTPPAPARPRLPPGARRAAARPGTAASRSPARTPSSGRPSRRSRPPGAPAPGRSGTARPGSRRATSGYVNDSRFVRGTAWRARMISPSRRLKNRSVSSIGTRQRPATKTSSAASNQRSLVHGGLIPYTRAAMDA